MTNKELSMEIRGALKAAGIPKSAYSIRCSYCGYSRSIDVMITDLSVKVGRVRDVVDHYSHVRWDEHCGEILSGGNTFVDVEYSSKALDTAGEAFMDRAKDLFHDDSLPLWEGVVIDESSRNGHDHELVYFKGDEYVASRVKGGSTIGNTQYYAGDARSLAHAMALFSACGTIPKYRR